MRLESHFYGMVDPSGGHEPEQLARMLVDAGARVLQLRLKNVGGRDLLVAARSISRMCHERGAIFIVNDRADIALLAEADGVHLGQTDLPLDAARRVVGRERIIGISTHSVEQAQAAEAGGADYIGFGPIFAGGLKQNQRGKGLDELRAVRSAVTLPIVAIGGITKATMPDVLVAGADSCAIITDVVKAPDVEVKVRALLRI